MCRCVTSGYGLVAMVVLGWWLDFMILEVISNLGDSMLLGCKHTLLCHVEFLVNQHLQVLLLRAALNSLSTQPVFVLGIAKTHMQHLALGLLELYKVHTAPLLKPLTVLLDGIPSLQHVDCTTQFASVTGKLAEGALHPTAHVTNKDVIQHWSQY